MKPCLTFRRKQENWDIKGIFPNNSTKQIQRTAQEISLVSRNVNFLQTASSYNQDLTDKLKHLNFNESKERKENKST